MTNAAGNTFTYDANGNQITRNANDVTWTSYNDPSRVENGTRYHDFFYDANRQRWKQVYYNGSASETTIFVGGILEKHTAGSLTEYRHYIQVGRQAVALYTRPSSGSITTQYLHLDHLGSVAEVTNGSGAVDVSENFDAFGQRRDATDWAGPPAAGVVTTIAGTSQRGYTFHTNLESSSLIHMNGRIADGLTGRFLSADPYITNPGGTQFFNRYSYVNNNPLSFTDPSGYCAEGITTYICKGIFDAVVGGFIKHLFGGRHKYTPPLPKGCWQNPNACYGKAGSSKLFDIASDVLKTPGGGMLGDWQSVWGYGQFGSAGCGQYCLNWGRQVFPDWETIHEGALIIAPGYDLGTCISSRGDCSVLDWGLAIFGTIPGEKLVALGVKATFAAAVVRQSNRVAARGAKVLPALDRTGKVHGALPHVQDLGRYSRDELRQLQQDLRQSVQERIRKTSELGPDRAHGQRQAAEQQLIIQIEKFLSGS